MRRVQVGRMNGQRFRRRLGFAFAGLSAVWRTEASFRSQARAAGLAAAALLILRPGALWCALTILSVGLVLALEAANAALEYVADAVHPGLAPGIKAAKDAAAGAVLLASLTAVGVAAALAVSLYRSRP